MGFRGMRPQHSFIAVCLVTLVLFELQISDADSHAFCPLTLSRPTCPDLQTYDSFDITTYGGRWFEIGSSANFKNQVETGGVCVIANYTLLQPPSPGKGAIIGVVNTIFDLGVPTHNVSQTVISSSATQICTDAFSICAQIDISNSSSTSISEGLSIVSNVTSALHGLGSSASTKLEAAVSGIETSVGEISAKVDDLSKLVNKIQILTAELGQEEGTAAVKVRELVHAVAKSNATAIKIFKKLKHVQKQTKSISAVAAKLQSDGHAGHSQALKSAVEKISAGKATIAGNVADIQAALAAVAGVTQSFLTRSTGVGGYSGRIIGEAIQNASFAGKLLVEFPQAPPGGYWIIAVELETGSADGGYSASLVYGCDQNEGGNGIEETLILLSRTPTLPANTVNRLLGKAAALGVTTGCSTPFIPTVQTRKCGNPPSDIAPYYPPA